jgi:hypothetical protein
MPMLKLRLYTLSFALCLATSMLPFIGLTQDSSSSKKKSFFSNKSVGAKFYYGSYLTTKAKAEFIRDSYSYFGEIFIEHQTNGDREWQVSHKYPQWGLAFLYGNSGSRQYIGNMAALYGYMNSPLWPSRRYKGSFILGFGPGWISKPYDIYRNSKNTLIGTHLNAFILMGLQNEFRISERLFLTGSLNFIHLSNGGTTLPNLGLNMPCISAGMRYQFNKPLFTPTITLKDESLNRGLEFNLYSTVGLKQAPWVGGNHYLINSLLAEIQKPIRKNYSIGLGMTIIYNRSISSFPYAYPATGTRNNKKLQVGIYGAYEHFFGKLSVPVHAGAHIYNKEKSPVFFQQFGVRYRISKHWGTELLLKSQLGKADFIHTGIGYHF